MGIKGPVLITKKVHAPNGIPLESLHLQKQMYCLVDIIFCCGAHMRGPTQLRQPVCCSQALRAGVRVLGRKDAIDP